MPIRETSRLTKRSDSHANAVTSAVHDRMPVILDPDAYDQWLDPGMQNAGAASDLLRPYDARLMRCYPVSSRINSVGNDDEGCSAPVELEQIQDRLF
jgi:putative SOS response-associated peptidase YedK